MALARADDVLTGALSKRRYAERDFDGVGRLRIQSLSELERKRWQLANIGEDGEVDFAKVPLAGPLLITATAVDEKGRRIFTDKQAELLAELDSRVIKQITDWIEEHCGLNDADIETTVGNSETIPSDVTP